MQMPGWYDIVRPRETVRFYITSIIRNISAHTDSSYVLI